MVNISLSEVIRPPQVSYASSVEETPELTRVINLPRRREVAPDAGALLTLTYARNPEACAMWSVICWLCGRPAARAPAPKGVMILSNAQAQCIADALDSETGNVGTLKVGEGKTPISYLIPIIAETQNCVLLVPGSLKKKTVENFKYLYTCFNGAPPHRICTYEELALKKNVDLLKELDPDYIIADECQALVNTNNAVTKRVARYGEYRAKENRNIKIIGLCANLWEGRRMGKYHHIMKWTLGDNMPLPVDRMETELWSRAVDADPGPLGRIMLGALRPLANKDADDKLDSVREWLGTRFKETPGIVCTYNPESPCRLELKRWEFTLGPKVKELLYGIYGGTLPDGTELVTDNEQIAAISQAPWGYYYKWRDPAPLEWLEARREWWKFIRETRRLGVFDTEDQIATEVRKGTFGECVPYLHWMYVKDDFKPVTVPVWVCTSTMQTILDNYSTDHVIFTGSRAIGFKLEEMGLEFFHSQGMSDRGNYIENVKGPRSIVASVTACHKGMNLQYNWSKLLFASLPNNNILEQAIGRVHRQGQEEELVTASFALPTEQHSNRLDALVTQARIDNLMHGDQKLAIGEWVE